MTLAFGGDVHFTGRTEGLLADPATAFGPISQALSAADIAMVNLKTAITERGTPEPKEFHFRAPPVALDALVAAGVDITTMANNHAVDYGSDGLDDTLAAVAASPIPVIGIGADAAAAYAPVRLESAGSGSRSSRPARSPIALLRPGPRPIPRPASPRRRIRTG